MSTDPLETIIQELLSARKYKGIDLPPEMVRDLLVKELPHYRSQKDAVQEVRKKLHNIVAPYLGDPDYPAAAAALEVAFQAGGPAVKAACTKFLASHASTLERLKIVDEFYPSLFALTGGPPHTILDLACGLNPLTLPWMGLPSGARYYAFDIQRPRLAFLNRFFELAGLDPLAIYQDVLVNPPQMEGDVAFLFKEAHRFEQRQRGCNRALWQALKVRYLLVSLPPHSLSGQHDMIDRQRRLVYTTVAGLPWEVTEVNFENEMVFVIQKPAEKTSIQ